jgi:hypothetical protein
MTVALRVLRRRADQLDRMVRLLRTVEIEGRMAKLGGHTRATTRHHDEPGRVLYRGPEVWGDRVSVRRV